VVDAYSAGLQAVEPDSEVFLGDPGSSHSVISIRPHQGRFLLRLADCLDRNQAEQFRGQEVRILKDRTDPLPTGVYYHSQILGLQVVEVGGRDLGEVSEILETGGNDVYVVRPANGAELLLPAISSMILEIDLEAKRIRVAIPPGLEEGK